MTVRAYFSKSTGSIYPVAVFSEFPEDALPIPDDLYDSFLNAEISAFDVIDGVVVAWTPPLPTEEEIVAQVIAQRNGLLEAAGYPNAPLQDAVDLGIATTEEQALLVAWKQYRVALNRIEQQPGFPHTVEWPQPPA